MADTGYNWGNYEPMQKAAGDWTSDALAQGVTETGDLTDLTGKATCEVGIDFYEDNTGAISGDATVYVLGSADPSNSEEPAQKTAWAFTVTPIQNDHVYKRFSIDPAAYGDFKLAVWNDSGQELAVTVKFRTATIPLAS